MPTIEPSVNPSFKPSINPTIKLSVNPSFKPSINPTIKPSVNLTKNINETINSNNIGSSNINPKMQNIFHLVGIISIIGIMLLVICSCLFCVCRNKIYKSIIKNNPVIEFKNKKLYKDECDENYSTISYDNCYKNTDNFSGSTYDFNKV